MSYVAPVTAVLAIRWTARAATSAGPTTRPIGRFLRSSSPRVETVAEELRKNLPIGRVVGPADVAALAVHLMANTAVTGATYDIDGGQQFVA